MGLFYGDLVISSVFYLAVCFPIKDTYRFYLYTVVDICVGYMVECDDRIPFGRIFRPYIVENDFSLSSNTQGEPFNCRKFNIIKVYIFGRIDNESFLGFHVEIVERKILYRHFFDTADVADLFDFSSGNVAQMYVSENGCTFADRLDF